MGWGKTSHLCSVRFSLRPRAPTSIMTASAMLSQYKAEKVDANFGYWIAAKYVANKLNIEPLDRLLGKFLFTKKVFEQYTQGLIKLLSAPIGEAEASET